MSIWRPNFDGQDAPPWYFVKHTPVKHTPAVWQAEVDQ